jgi:thiaminase
MGLHIEYSAGFGLSKADILNQEEKLGKTTINDKEECLPRLQPASHIPGNIPESKRTQADNSRFVLDIGQSEDWFALQMAIFPCLLGYGMIARRLFHDPNTLRDGNRYWKWIENYAADDFQEAVSLGRGK